MKFAKVGRINALPLGVVLALGIGVPQSAEAQTYSVLYTFKGGADGNYPYGGLVRDAKGNLYGTTYFGGASGAGTVFKLDTTGKKKVLHSFTGGKDGGYPVAGVIRDAAGNLYGTTLQGGAFGAGTVFKVDTSGHETVLYSFDGVFNGAFPYGGLIRDANGNIYGTTSSNGFPPNTGTVFELDPSGHYIFQYPFTNRGDGEYPLAGVIMDADGNLYGTTYYGGTSGAGAVFKIDTTRKETVLHSFGGNPTDGTNPIAGVIRDGNGNLYGTTYFGGTSSNCGSFGCGIVFKLDSTGKETVLHTFVQNGQFDGANPTAGLVRDANGNLYGTTYFGGGGSNGAGVVFKLDKAGKETFLKVFDGLQDGGFPYAGLIRDKAGNLYGTTQLGGNLTNCTGSFNNGCGVVFKITPQ